MPKHASIQFTAEIGELPDGSASVNKNTDYEYGTLAETCELASSYQPAKQKLLVATLAVTTGEYTDSGAPIGVVNVGRQR